MLREASSMPLCSCEPDAGVELQETAASMVHCFSAMLQCNGNQQGQLRPRIESSAGFCCMPAHCQPADLPHPKVDRPLCAT